MTARSIRTWAARFATVALVLSAFAIVPACNTVQGAGEDVKAVGEGGERVLHGEPAIKGD